MEDFARFSDAPEVHLALEHLAGLTPEQVNNLAVQHRSGQEVVERAQTLITKLQETVDKALNAGFSA